MNSEIHIVVQYAAELLQNEFSGRDTDAKSIGIAVMEAYNDYLMLPPPDNADIKQNPAAYIINAARHKIIDEIRRRRRLTQIDSDTELLVSEDSTSASDARIDIEALLLLLPPKQAEAFRLYEVDGRTEAEIAEMLGISVRAVQYRIHDAREKLRKMKK